MVKVSDSINDPGNSIRIQDVYKTNRNQLIRITTRLRLTFLLISLFQLQPFS